MKRLILITVLLIAFNNAFAQQWLWGRGAACQHQSSEAWIVKTDPFNNIYIAGQNQSDTLCLGSHYFYAPPSVQFNRQQMLLAKYDSAGNVLWTTSSTSGFGSFSDIVTDPNGNVYATGVFLGPNVQFGPYTVVNPHYQTTIFYYQAYFIVKFDSAGNVIWAVAGDNITGNNQRSPSIKLDSHGNIYLTSTFVNPTLQVGNTTLTNTSVTGKTDFFVAKYDTAGHPLWAKGFGSPGDDNATGIALGKYDDVYVTGQFIYDSITLGNTTLQRYYNVIRESFLLKLDTSGQVLWAKGTFGGGKIQTVVNDSDGNIYMGGRILSDFLVLGSDTLHVPLYSEAAVLAKYNPAGSILWAKALPSVAQPSNWNNEVFDLAVDKYNNIWACGQLALGAAGMQVDSTDTIVALPPGSDPAFIVCYCSQGELRDHMAITSGGDDYSGIIPDQAGNIYWCGDFMSVDPFVLGDTLHVHGIEDIFVAKYHPSPATAIGCPSTEHVNQRVSFADKITLYPNPAIGTVTIQSSDMLQNATAALYDITGRMVSVYMLRGRSTTISVQNLTPGVYQCQISDEQNHFATKKLLIMP